MTPQLDLFDDRHLTLDRARQALAAGDLAAARHDLLAIRARYPGDAGIAAELARAQELLVRLGEIEDLAPEARAAALLGAAEREAGAVRTALLRRVAVALRDAGGDGALLGEKPPGAYFLLGGDVAAARASLCAAMTAAPRGRFLALLADADLARGDPTAARRAYRDALLFDPYDVDLACVADGEIAALPEIAANELGIEEDPVAWAAPVGIVIGVLPAGVPELPLPDTPRGPLMQARAFVRAFAERSGVAARREMKRLCPALFAAYMDHDP